MLISLQSENIIKDFFRRSTLNVEGKFFVVSGAKTENCLPLPRYHMEVVPLSSHRAASYSTMRASFRRNEILPSFRAKKNWINFLICRVCTFNKHQIEFQQQTQIRNYIIYISFAQSKAVLCEFSIGCGGTWGNLIMCVNKTKNFFILRDSNFSRKKKFYVCTCVSDWVSWKNHKNVMELTILVFCFLSFLFSEVQKLQMIMKYRQQR